MPFERTEEPDEIDDQAERDNKHRAVVEAPGLCGKVVADLFRRMLATKGKKYKFENLPKDSGYMEVRIGDFIYRIGLAIVPQNAHLDLEELKGAKNYELFLKHLSKFFLYSEMIFDVYKSKIRRDFPDVLDWKMQVDHQTSTMFIDPDYPKRIGFMITKRPYEPPVTQESARIIDAATLAANASS